MKKLLWIGDAVVSSGFAKATHAILDTLKDHYEVHVLGLSYFGDPHSYPYPIYPAFVPGGDAFGVRRIKDCMRCIGPDVVVVQNDPWNVPEYMKRLGSVPTIASIPVDGHNCRGLGLNGLTLAVFWTEFALEQARLGGYTGPATIIPLGVDTQVYHPIDRYQARTSLRYPERVRDAFIIGNVNRNQPRKRMDLTLSYFAEWVKSFDVQDACLSLHVAPTGEDAYDIPQLAQYFGIANRLLVPTNIEIGFGSTEEQLVLEYNSFDAMLTTTQGEGWGLTTMEGMACGIPQIYPSWAALGEWAIGWPVPCTSMACTMNGINAIGGIMDRELAIDALQDVYTNHERRALVSAEGRDLVSSTRFHWKTIGEQWVEAIDRALDVSVTIPVVRDHGRALV